MFNNVKKVYFIGICGTAMGNAAVMIKKLGVEVRGSDSGIYPPMSDFLQENGIEILDGFTPHHLDWSPDLVVVGNAVSRGNPEVEEVLDRQLHYISLPELLKEFFIRGKNSIVVTGTHGKTTTSSILAQLYSFADRQPGFIIGGVLPNFNTGYRLGQGNDFIIEGDEYDTAFFDKRSKFFHYLPFRLIINNIEFDHADIFDSLEDIKRSFKLLLRAVPSQGLVVANAEDPVVREVMNLCHSRMETYGFSQGDWLIVDHRFDHDWLEFSLTRENKRFGPFKAHLSGMHNLQNCAAAIICGLDNGIDEDILAAGLAEFMGVKRRLEHRGDYGGVTIYDDFAHHPTAIMETIKGIKTSYPQRTTWAVFEPRTNTMRRKNLAGNLEKSLAEADKVLLLPVDHPEKIKAAERLDPELIVKNLSLTGKKAFGPQTMEEAIDILQQNTSPGDVVVFMSNGSLEKMIIEYIEQRKKS